jgi:hypothetical protein
LGTLGWAWKGPLGSWHGKFPFLARAPVRAAGGSFRCQAVGDWGATGLRTSQARQAFRGSARRPKPATSRLDNAQDGRWRERRLSQFPRPAWRSSPSLSLRRKGWVGGERDGGIHNHTTRRPLARPPLHARPAHCDAAEMRSRGKCDDNCSCACRRSASVHGVHSYNVL